MILPSDWVLNLPLSVNTNSLAASASFAINPVAMDSREVMTLATQYTPEQFQGTCISLRSRLANEPTSVAERLISKMGWLGEETLGVSNGFWVGMAGFWLISQLKGK